MMSEEMVGENSDLLTMRSIIWHCMYTTLVVITISTNIVVIAGVIMHKKPRSTTSLFLANLSMGDIFVSSLHVPFVYLSILKAYWPFGSIFCTTTVFIRLVVAYMSVGTFMIVPYKRYKCILNRARRDRCKFSMIFILLSIWILSSMFSTSMLPLVHNDGVERDSGTLFFCYIKWPDVTGEIGFFPGIISVSTYMIGMCFIPFVWSLCISLLAKSSLKAPQPQSIAGENHMAKTVNSIVTIKLVMCMLVVHILFWLPLNMMEIFRRQIRNWITDAYFDDVWLGVFWLAMSQGMFRPLIYYWIDPTIYDYLTNRRSRKSAANSAPMNNVYSDLRTEISTVKGAIETISDRVILVSDEVMSNETNIESLTLLVRNIETKLLELDHRVNMQYLEFIKPSAPFGSFAILPQRRLSECSTRPASINKRRKSVSFGSTEMNEIPEVRNNTDPESGIQTVVRYPRIPNVDSTVCVTSRIS